MTIIALYNIKGGVGKTTACVNLSYAASVQGFQTLLIDLDPQGAAGYHCNVQTPDNLDVKKFLKAGGRMKASIRSTDYPNFDILPADISYRNLPLILDDVKHPKKRLRTVFEEFEGAYDFLFLDCPPNLGLEAENVVRAADLVLVPVIPSPLSMRSLDMVIDFFKPKAEDEPDLFRAFFSMVDRRKAAHRDLADNVPVKDGRYFRSHIPYCADVENSSEQRKPVTAIKKKSPAKDAFFTLWTELITLRH